MGEQKKCDETVRILLKEEVRRRKGKNIERNCRRIEKCAGTRAARCNCKISIQQKLIES